MCSSAHLCGTYDGTCRAVSKWTGQMHAKQQYLCGTIGCKHIDTSMPHLAIYSRVTAMCLTHKAAPSRHPTRVPDTCLAIVIHAITVELILSITSRFFGV